MFEQRVNSDVLTVSTVNSQDQVTQKPLRDSVKQALKNYFAQLNGQDVNDLYELVLAEVEQPLLDMVMQYTRGNQTLWVHRRWVAPRSAQTEDGRTRGSALSE
jgi:Fis family transcriptional regulator